MKKIIESGFLCIFLIPSVFSRNGEYVGGASFIKRTEYNLIMLEEVYNLRSKGEVEKLLFGDFNAPVEFFYNPSFQGASGFRIVKDSMKLHYYLELKHINNFDEVNSQLSEEYPSRGFSAMEISSVSAEQKKQAAEYNNAMYRKQREESLKRFKVETRSIPVSDRFAEILYNKTVSFIASFKGKGVPPTVADGYSVTFRTVVEDEVWSLAIHMPNGEALKMADMCRQIITDAEKNELDESKYILLPDN